MKDQQLIITTFHNVQEKFDPLHREGWQAIGLAGAKGQYEQTQVALMLELDSKADAPPKKEQRILMLRAYDRKEVFTSLYEEGWRMVPGCMAGAEDSGHALFCLVIERPIP